MELDEALKNIAVLQRLTTRLLERVAELEAENARYARTYIGVDSIGRFPNERGVTCGTA